MVKKSNKIKYIITAVMITALAAWFLTSGGDAKLDTSYRTQRVKMGQLRVAVSATGTLNPVMVVKVGTQVSGTVKEIMFDYNEEVKAGQLLLTIDDEQFAARVNQSRANLASAQAKLKLAQVKYDRYKRLYAAKTSTKEELDQAEADRDIAQASLDQSAAMLEIDEYNLKNVRIHSPVDGVVINKSIDIGQTVAASFQTPTLVEIAQDLTKMQIDADFTEADIGRLKPGLKASFSVDAYPGENFTGQVRQIRLNPSTQQNVVTYDVVIDVDNPDLKLLPGMTAYVDIELHREDDVLLAPNAALNFRPAEDKIAPPAKGDKPGKTVYVLDGGKLKKVDVATGGTDQRQTVITGGGLKDGDLVVVGENGGNKGPGGAMPRRGF